MQHTTRASHPFVATVTVLATVLMPYLASVPVAQASSQEYGTLVLELYVRGGSASFDDFRYDVDGAMMGARGHFVATGVTTFDNVPAGEQLPYQVSGQSPDGYAIDYGGDCDAQGAITIPGGGTATCSITNTAEGWQEGDEELGPLPEESGVGGDSAAEPTLIVEASICNGWIDGIAFADFGFTIGSSSHRFDADGANDLSLESGEYAVIASPAEGYAITYSRDCDGQGNVAVTDDEPVICRITYALSVGGFNPGGEPIPPPPAVGTGGTGGQRTAVRSPEPVVPSESPSPVASPSDDNVLAAAIAGIAGLAPCGTGPFAWIILNAVVFLGALWWFARAGTFAWWKALVVLAILAAIMSRWRFSCGDELRWLPPALAAITLLRLWLRKNPVTE